MTQSAPAFSQISQSFFFNSSLADQCHRRQIVVLQNDFHFRAVSVGLIANRLDVLGDVSQSPLSALPRLITISISAAPSRHASSVSYRFDSVHELPCGNPMTAPTSTSLPSKPLRGLLHGVRLDANRSHVVPGSESTALFQLLIRHRGMQKRVIDHLGHFFVTVLHEKVLSAVCVQFGSFRGSKASRTTARVSSAPLPIHSMRNLPRAGVAD